MIIEVYTKPSCPLCEEGVDLVEDIALELGAEVHRRNILEEPRWFERYRHRVPVVAVDGVERLSLRFDEREVRAALGADRAP